MVSTKCLALDNNNNVSDGNNAKFLQIKARK